MTKSGLLMVDMLKRWLKNYYIDSILILSLPLIALWGFLFVSGYYFYADQGWPLSNYIYANDILSLNSLNGFSFSRLIVGWPYYIISMFSNNIKITERVFIYYTFVLYTLFAYFLASMITSKLLITKNKFEIKFVKFLIVIFIFSNFTALNLNADGGSFADGLNIIFIAMTLFAFVEWKDMRMAFLLSAVLLTISVLIEPDYTTFYIISILGGSIIAGILKKDLLYRFKYAVLSVFSLIIPVSFVIYSMYLTAGIGETVSALGVARAYNYGSIAFFSGNIKVLYPLILTGHLWSTIVFAPPSVLAYGNKIFSIKSLMYPSQLLLPTGLITELWLFAVIMIPVLSFMSLFFKQTRSSVIPVFILFVIFYIMSLVIYIKPLFNLEYDISNLPLIGGAIGTTLALPGHIINVIAAMYYILLSITFIELFNKSSDVVLRFEYISKAVNSAVISDVQILKKKFSLNGKQIKIIISFFITFVILFSGWQAFDGSFFPARSPEVPYGNGIADIGAFTPVPINSSVLHAYDFISSQKQDFNIIWIGGPEYSERPYGYAHSAANIPNLPFLVQNNMKDAFYYDLLADNVKYVVISNQDIQQNASGIFVMYTFNSAGFNSFKSAKAFMSGVKGLVNVYSKDQVDIYQVKDFSTIYKSNLLINYDGNSPYVQNLYSLFSTLGYNASITDFKNYGIPFSINNNLKEDSIYSPENVTSLIQNSDFRYYNLSDNINITGEGHNGAVSLPDNYTLTLWTNDMAYYNYTRSVINLHMTNDTYTGASISYNGSFDGGAGGFLNKNKTINMTVTFQAKSTYSGKEGITFMGEPRDNINTDNIFVTKFFNVSDTCENFKFSFHFPPIEKYINFRIYSNYPGIIKIKNLSTKNVISPEIYENSNLPFGNYICLNKTFFKTGQGAALLYIKNDTLKNYTWIKYDTGIGLYIKDNTKIAAVLIIKNNSLVAYNNISYIISQNPADNDFELEYNNNFYNPIPGIFGNSIFVIYKNLSTMNQVKIITKGKTVLDLIYAGILVYLIMLAYFLAKKYRKKLIIT